MRAVETADAEVHDAGGESSAVARDRLGAGDGARHVLRAEVRAGGELGRVRLCRMSLPLRVFFLRGASFTRFVWAVKSFASKVFKTFPHSDWLAT